MMQQINPGLMKVLAAQSQINPMTPEGAPSVAANVLAQAGQAPGIAAIGQQAQEALPSMMRNAQDDQAKQMLEAAQRASQPAGIAGLNIPMGQFADGGVVGYNGTDTSEVNLGGVSGIPYYAPGPSEERDRLNQLPLDAAIALWELIKKGGAKFVEGTTMDPNYNKPKEPPSESVPATLGAQAPTGGGLTTEAARGQAPREERVAPPASRPAPRMDSGIAAGRATAAVPTTIPGEDLYQAALKMADQYKGTDGRTAEQIQRDRLAEYQRRGLPDLRQMAEERIKQTSAFDEETRRLAGESNKAAMQNAWASGILQPGARNLAELFGGAARSMIGEEGKQAQSAVAARLSQRAQMILDNQIREALDKADIAAANGDLATEQAEKAKAQEFANKKVDIQREIMMNRAKEVVDYRKTMDAEKLRQAGAERVAALKGESASAKPIYDIINDNVEKQMTAWSQVTTNKYASPEVVAAQRAKFVADQIRFAKAAGHKITPEMEALIKGTSAAPGTRENPIKLD